MTEDEWNTCDDPKNLLEWLRGKASDRKFRLLSAASVRAFWQWLDDERSRSGVILLEQLADGLIGPEERIPAAAAAQSAADEAEKRWENGANTANTREQIVDLGTRWWAAEAVALGLGDDAWRCSMQAVSKARFAAFQRREAAERDWAWEAEGTAQVVYIHEIFDIFNPVSLDPAWLTPTVTAIAEAIYEEKAFDGLPILADDLEEAGCANATVLYHCRHPGPHVRGCWCLDLLLGKD